MTAGYRDTDFGVIPEGWDVMSIAQLFSLTNGVNADRSAYGRGVPFINVLEPISHSHLWGFEIPGRVQVSNELASSYAVRRGDVVFNRTSETDSELGLAAVYLGDEPVVFGGFVIRGRPRGDSLDPLYSGYALRSPQIRSQIVPMGQGAVRSNIGQQNLGRVLVPVPSKGEQLLIAAALSDVQRQVASLSLLIAKKRDIKKAAMQQLLTGQTRLPGFRREWEVKRLGDHVAFLKNGVFPRAATLMQGTVRYLHYGDIHGAAGVILDPAEVAMPFLSVQDSARLDRLVTGDLVFADASEDLAGVGKSLEIRNAGADEVVAGLHTIAARFDQRVLADGFKAYLQHMPTFRNHLLRLAAGTKVLATNRGHIASAELGLPGTDEQAAIAAILSDMDAELASLEARRHKTRALKEAMMQELLTGRARLV